MSFTNVWQGITNYVDRGWVFKFLIIQLSGLPPVFVFFLKVNLIALSLRYTSIILQVLIFINLLLGMFFYLQIFSTTGDHFSSNTLKMLVKDTSLIEAKRLDSSKKKYNFYLFFCTVSFISFFSFVFFFDFYIIMYAFLT